MSGRHLMSLVVLSDRKCRWDCLDKVGLVHKFRMMNMEISAGPQPVNSTETSSHHCNWLRVVAAGACVCVCVCLRAVIMTFHLCLRSPRWGCLCCLTGLSYPWADSVPPPTFVWFTKPPPPSPPPPPHHGHPPSSSTLTITIKSQLPHYWITLRVLLTPPDTHKPRPISQPTNKQLFSFYFWS